MSLEDTIRELKSQLAEADKAEEEEEEVEEQVKEEPVAEEVTAEPEKPEPTKEEVLDDAGYARLRREKRAAEKRAEELEAKLAAKEAEPKEENATEESIPDILRPLIEKDKEERAFVEFQSLESKFRDKQPAYDDIAGQYFSSLAASIKVQNPRLSNDEIVKRAKREVLVKAGEYLNAGFDPVEEMYHDALELGFKPRPKEEVKVEKEEPVKPDMKQLAKNRSKSTGMVDATGKEDGLLTRQAASELSVAEWAKLSKEDKRRLLQNA